MGDPLEEAATIIRVLRRHLTGQEELTGDAIDYWRHRADCWINAQREFAKVVSSENRE